MTEIVSRSELKRRHWFNIVNECTRSGIPIDVWCKQNHIPVSTFWYWYTQFRNMTEQQLIQNIPEFVELKETDNTDGSDSDSIMIEKNGIHINIDESVSDELITKILRCLSNV